MLAIFAINIITSLAAAFEAERLWPKARFEKLSEHLDLDPYQECYAY